MTRKRGVKKRSRTRPHLVLDLTFLPARRWRAGDGLDKMVRAHLEEAAIVLPILADEDRLHRRLHVVVDAAGAGAPEEREGPLVGVEHQAMICAGKHPAQSLTKARILLKADVSEAGEGWSDSAISAALDTSINNIGRTRRRLVEEGMAAALTRKYNPNSARPRTFDGAAEAKLIALTCSPATEGFARWSLRLLEEKVVELNIVEKASDNTIGRTLKKTSSSPTAIGNG